MYKPSKALIALRAFADCDETLMWLLMRLLLESGVETCQATVRGASSKWGVPPHSI